MNFRRTRWVDGAVSVAAVLSAVQLFDAVPMSLPRSIAAGLLFASSVFGIDRLYSAMLDLFILAAKRASTEGTA